MTLDAKTGERVEFLFAHRAKLVSKDYIHRTIIPALSTKAGVPASAVRGKITSHRARSTIASQLYNAKEPMALFELQAWLGHRSPSSTYSFFEQCQHRMAHARCDFYPPKKATPAGPKPRELGLPVTVTMLPIVEVRQGQPE
ncbi:hypothetical protein OOK36_06700 [Streptomyces sp. NBC_00365]|uniref:hypothetical protein n=1 Tax=Streptomyces sp. NBC_00365 TaxID=2975726 RepID=UPI00224DD5A4|nr:hypothetical protein [Streptomyces sp. NBC_00365]MCX5088587.1 hypothetical protein [Streptomyces sp. NBC_00365]